MRYRDEDFDPEDIEATEAMLREMRARFEPDQRERGERFMAAFAAMLQTKDPDLPLAAIADEIDQLYARSAN
jgi:hypothetical protein